MIPITLSSPYTTNSKAAACLFTLGARLRTEIPITQTRELNGNGVRTQYAYWFEDQGIWRDRDSADEIHFSTMEALKEWGREDSSNLPKQLKYEVRVIKYQNENIERLNDFAKSAQIFHAIRNGDRIRLKNQGVK
jgi:hypothetical protein